MDVEHWNVLPFLNGVAVFSFLTTGYHGDPTGHLVGAIHSKAIPVIPHLEDCERWSLVPVEDALRLAKALPRQLITVA